MKRDNAVSFSHTEIVVDFVSHTLQECVFEVACDICPFDNCRMRQLSTDSGIGPLLLLRKYSVAVAFVSETLLLPSHSIYLPGYNVIRSDRPDRKGGGVALVLHYLIAFDALSTTADSPFASVGARTTLGNSKIAIYSIYNPPKK